MKTLTKIAFVILGIFTIGCIDEVLMPGGEDALIIYNNTNERVFFWYSGVYSEDYHYPDTILPAVKPEYISSVSANNGTGASSGYVDWEYVYAQLPAGKLSVYFFETNPQTQAEWDEIRGSAELIKRKDVGLDELRSNDYTIDFP